LDLNKKREIYCKKEFSETKTKKLPKNNKKINGVDDLFSFDVDKKPIGHIIVDSNLLSKGRQRPLLKLSLIG